MLTGLATATQGQGLGIGNLLILLLPLILLAFLMMQQRKRVRQVSDLQTSLQVGEEVVTTSGMYGRIVAFEDPAVVLEVSPGVRLRFDRRAIGARAPQARRPLTPGSDAPEHPSPNDGPVSN